jgi:hypothetical protein
MEYLWAILLVLTLLAGWLLTLFSLPGNWLMVAAAAVYAFFLPGESRLAVSWWVVGTLTALAVLGELLELVASALGVAKGGGSKRGAVLAMLFSVPGAILGGMIGLPIPVVGPIVGIVVFAGLGALVGAMIGERWKGRNLRESFDVGASAFWGRVLGSVAKVTIASMMVAIGTAAVIFK